MNESLKTESGRLAAIREVLNAVPSLDELTEIETVVVQMVYARKNANAQPRYDDDNPAVRNQQLPASSPRSFKRHARDEGQRDTPTRSQDLLS